MAWPKGKPRKVELKKPPIEEPAFDLLAVRRQICAMRVRRQVIPRELRAHDYLLLPKVADIIRLEMLEANAPDSEVEDRVAKLVTQV